MSTAMTCKISLKLLTGADLELELPEPGRAPTAYFVFMRDAGQQWIWPLVRTLLNTAGQPCCDYRAWLRERGCAVPDVRKESLHELFRREGYAFGIVPNPVSLPADLDALGRHTVLFMRDPREIVAALQVSSGTDSISQFVRSQAVADLAAQCRRFADFCRARRHVIIVRFEDLARGWTQLVDELRERLGLAMSSDAAIRIARSMARIPQSALDSQYRRRFEPDDRFILERQFAETLAFFGYLPDGAPSPAFLEHWSDFERAVTHRLSSARPASPRTTGPATGSTGSPALRAPAERRPSVHELDPELLWRARANSQGDRVVLGRRITQEVDAYGCRPVLGQPPTGERTLAAYGCSITYGTAVPFEETFCSMLQGMVPSWRVENHGCGGYSTVQNWIQLRRNSRWTVPDYVTFCYYPDHRLRNVAAIEYRRKNMASDPQTISMRQQPYPRAALAPDGSLEIRHVRHPRWDLDGIDLVDFQHEDYYLDLVTAAIFERAADLVRQTRGHFFVTTLMGDLSPALRNRLDCADIPVLNAGIEGKQYTCLPDDPHPNGIAHRHYAQRLRDYLLSREGIGCASAPIPA